MNTTYYHKISDLMAGIVRSSFLSPLAIFSQEPLDTQITDNIKFSQVKVGSRWNKEVLDSYIRVNRVEAGGEFSMLGDTYIVFIKHTPFVLRFELFGEKVEAISLLDSMTLRKEKDFNEIYFPSIQIPDSNKEDLPYAFKQILEQINNQLENLVIDYDLEREPTEVVNFFLEKSLEINDEYFALPVYVGKEKLWMMDLQKYVREEYKLKYYGQNTNPFEKKINGGIQKLSEDKEKVKEFLDNCEYIFDQDADKGFYSNAKKIVVVTDQEIFGTLFFKSTIQNKNISKLFNGEIKIGDFIVHELHGVGIYKGIISQEVGGELRDYLQIQYLDNDTLYVPYESLDKVSKFVGEGGEPKLTRLGSGEWENVKAKAKKDIEEIADELLDLYARREMEKGFSYDISKTREMYDQLISDFPYEDTPDQERCTNEILEDLESEKPMDRLLVGDVGFGKTEMAVRAAFIAVLNKKQVIVLAPTTILVSQLYKVFVERLSKFGVNIAKVSRFEGPNKNKESIVKLGNGSIDIIIGTHRLLSSDVQIKNMGLLIIDEEQRFGVKQKEKIKSLKANLDVLSMSATPIPRTLQMSLSGIREISVISTPPPGRKPVTTSLITKGEIFGPIENELERNGQVFIVHNNISTIYSLEEKIKLKIPGARIIVGHAKMPGPKLEKIMLDFANKEYDILIATTIIENGIDIPAVNTMIIDDANMFGLSQLHQLRGRVGRSSVQAFCYLIVPYRLNNGKIDLKEHKKMLKQIQDSEDSDVDKKTKTKNISVDGIERIKAIIEHQNLGSGFHIASKDLEIRGSGSMLGASQSGHINSVGYDMYLRMLYQEIDKKKKMNRIKTL